MTQKEMNELKQKFNDSMVANKVKLKATKASIKDLRIDFTEKVRENLAEENEKPKWRYVTKKSHFDFAAVENMVRYFELHTIEG